ncbi:hypothetical protein [Aureibacter tunicatorum]|uniref:Lipoprotein n=1 Tax=Aureibacter tunicatorum TaxID=866807 RepID=A0AAE3XJM3_9BACT|nr:hypothetical protein [Aureibacter tunicatorum]MDR6237665.1 hypothetical protein [Aureibacter tunicatorum]BDD02700.1 hypothetical protein AUTU_01830 [Aureibacter tunicatorum]
MRSYIFIFFICLGFMSCTSSSKKVSDKSPKSDLEGFAEKTIVKEERLVNFTSVNSQDLFRLSVGKNDLLRATVSFDVLNKEGKIIYHDEFDAIELVDRQVLNEQEPSEEERIAYINGRLMSFFADSHFLRPAISTTMSFNPEIDVKKYWQTIKEEKAIGFIYKIGLSTEKYIAFDRNEGKVVVYKELK